MGFSSDNIVSYDLETNVAKEVFRFGEITRPRGLAQSSNGDLFVATRQGNKNVIRISLTDEGIEFTDFTDPIGRYGPAQVYIDDDDQIYVAGDTTHEVRVYLPNGSLGRSYQGKSVRGNVCGFAVGADALFAAHLFRGALEKHSLEGDIAPTRFQMDPEVMKNTYTAFVAPTGNLLVGGGRGNGKVLELDPMNGEVLGVFADLGEQGLDGVSSMIYVKGRQSYFFPSPSGLLEYDKQGAFVGRHDIDFIDKVIAIGIARNPQAVDRMARTVGVRGEAAR